MTTSGSQQVVFIDSRVSDIQDLLNGVQPGDLVFVLDPNSDGVQQIADILAANHLTDLAAIAIVGHGAAGSIDLGSSVVTDANLSSYADALAKIGASLTASGDLQLYACDVASGATGATFIADLAALTGADVAAATHLVGSADLGGSWTLDASTGPIEAGTPFTQAALDNFQGDLVAPTVTGQLWVGAGGNGVGNPDGHSDFRVYRSDSDGLADDRIIAKENVPTGAWTAVGLDTSANLFFALDNSLHFTVNNLTTGAQLTSTTIGSTADSDVINSFVVDPRNNIIYADLFGYDYLDANPAPYSGLHGGDLIKFTYNQSTGAVTPAYTFNDAGPTHSINMNDVLIDSGTTSGATRYADGRSFWLSPDSSTLYYVDDNNNDPGSYWGFSTNAIFKVSTTGSVGTGDAPTPVLLSSQAQFPVNDSLGYITSLTVDPTLGIIYFTTDDSSGQPDSAHPAQNAIWWMPIAGGTATAMTLPGGTTLKFPVFYGQNITFDPNARVLYVADQGDGGAANTVNGHIIKLTLSGDGHSFTSGVNDFAQFDTNGISDISRANSILFDALPNLSVAGTTNHAGEQGANINLDTSVTLSDDQGRLASFSVQITGGTFSSNETSNNDDHLSVNGQISGALGGALSGITVSWNSATETLTLSGDDTVAHYQTAVSEIQYNTTGDNPTNYGANTTRTITWIASDGVTITHPDASDPNQKSTTITIDAVNDAPTVSSDVTFNLNETNSGLSATSGSRTLSDPDSTTVSVAKAVVASGNTSGAPSNATLLSYLTSSPGIFSGPFSPPLTFTETFNSASEAFNYLPAGQILTLTYDVQVTDTDQSTGGANPLTTHQTVTVNITGTNDAPALTAGGTQAYTEQNAAVVVDNTVTVNDVDSTTLAGATVTISAGLQAGDTLHFTNQNGISIVSYAAGVLTLSGTATLADYQTALRSVTFDNLTNDNPTNGGANPTRTISWQVDDGSGAGNQPLSNTPTSTINITGVNDPPVVGGAGNTVGYTEQAAAIALDSSLTVNDVDNANLTGATVKISAGLQPGDTLHFTNQNGITGAYDAASGILTLTGSSSVANYQTALRSVTFDNASNNDPTDKGLYPARTIDWQVNDGTALTGALFGTATNFTTATQPYSVAIGDLNGDGKLDLAVANFGSGNVSVLLGNGGGTFTAANNFAAGSGPTSVAIGDFNGDGKLDLAVADSGANDVSVLLGDGLGGFAAATSFSVDTAPYAVAIADLNGDGKLDLVTANSGSDDVSVLLGDGTGGFGTATNFTVGTGPESVAIGDFNGDGKLDIAVANVGSDNVSVLLGNGDGSFGAATNFTVGTGPVSVAIGDFNGDGKLDLVTANDGSDNVSVLLGNGSGGFGAASNFGVGSVPYSVAVADLNGDGKADLAVGNNGSGNVSVLLGNGSGSFAAATNFAVGTNPVPVAIGDLDGSGGLDLVAANEGSDNLSVLLNASTNLSSTQHTTVNVTAVNDPPVLFSGFNNVVGFTEGGAATTLSSSGVIEDPDNTTLASATAQITTGLLAGDTLSVDLPMTGNLVDGTNITVTYTAGTGLLTLSGTDTLANYQNVIEHVQYSTASVDPTNGGADTSRIVTWQLDDGAGSNNLSATATTEVDITAVNSPPVVGGAGNSVLYPALSSGTTLDANLTVSDVDNANLTGATVRISSGLQFGDRLNFANQNGITGSYDAVNGILTLTGTASIVDYQTALRSITFDSTSANPTDSGLYVHRTIDWQVNDGTGPVSPLFQNQVTYPVGTTVESVVAGDFNKDGKLDLAFPDYYAAVAQVALGNGDGTFGSAVPYSVGNGAVGIATGDINNDGNPDLVVSNALDNTVSILLGNGDGTFQPQQTIGTDTAPFYVALADFNADGKLDLVVGANDTIALALGNGDGTFGVQTVVAAGADAAIGDFNNDGKLDLAVHDTSGGAISVLLGNGNGTFGAPTSVATGDGVAAGDFNGDGKADLAVLDYAGGNILTYLGDGTGTSFTLHGTYAAGGHPNIPTVGDVNGDGILDLAVSNYNPDNEFNLLIGDGSGGFAAPETHTSGISGVGAVIGDFDGVNGPDVATANRDSTNALSVYLNNANNLSGVQHTTVTIDAAPVLANAGNTVAYIEQQTSPTAIFVDSTITVTDTDSANLSGATVKITGGVFAGDLLAATTGGTGITAVWNGTDTLTLSGADTKAHYQQVLESVTFTTPSDDPTNGGANPSRTITWTVTDDLGASSAPGTTTTINVTAVNDGPSAIITPASYAATEGVSLNLKNNGLSVSDVDGNTGSETVTLSVGPEGILNVTPGTSGAFVSNSGTATVTIAGTAAQINALLNTDGTSTVAYIDNNDIPAASATLTLAINDNGHTGGGNLTSSDSATINITSVNDPPVFTNLGGPHPHFTEKGSSVVLDNDVTVSDPELQASPNKYAGATLTLARDGGANPDDSFAGTGSLDLTDVNGNGENVSLDNGATFIGTYTNPGDGSISFTFNANATAANIASVMHQIVYADSSDNPPASVQIDWTFSDGNGQPGGQTQGDTGPTPGIATGSVIVDITQVDDPPALLNVATAASYTPGSPGQVLSPALQAYDPDAAPPSPNPGLVSATITITTGFLAGDQLFVNLPTSGGFFVVDDGSGPVTTNISVTSNAGGQLVLGGLDSVLHYQDVLDAVSYHSTAADPTNGGADLTRTINWKVSDGALDNQAPSPPLYPETTLGFNAAPAVDLDTSAPGTGYVTTFTENGAPLAIANSNASVTDADDATISSATIVLTNAKPGDALSIAGALPAGIGSSIDTSVPGQITIHLTGQAPVADYQTAVGQIRFVNTSDNPDATDRDITVQVSNSEDSNVAHATIHVIPVNDAPVLANVAAGAAAPPGSGPVTLSPALTVSDVDNTTLASATVAITAGTFAGDGDVLAANTSGTSITAIYNPGLETLTLSGTDTLAHYQQVLESVTFNSTSPNPTNGGVNPTRTVSWQVNDGSGSNNLSAVATTKIQIASPRNDFNGDQVSDLLLQNAALGNTSVMIDLMNGVAITSSATIPNFTNLQVKATGDFNHDNKADIVLQASDGTPQIWFMNGTSVASTTSLSNPGASWHIIATGDFNHDGNTDILWQDNNGTAAVWLMNGTTLIGGGAPPNPGASWHVIGAGDFNADGNSDVLWQNDNGTPAIWEMNGATIIGGGAMPNPGVAWHAIGTGDFNGDGKADILWQNDNGTPAIWLMDGTTIIGGGAMTNPGIAWHAIGTSDFNADGKSDILWQNNDGTPAIWEMNGTTIIGGGVVSNPGPTWHLKDDGPIVFDAAAASAATGAASVSTLPGSALLSSNSTNLFGDPTNLPGSGSPSSSPTSSNFFGNPTNPAGSGPPSPSPTSGNFFGIPTNLPGSGQAPAAIFHSAPDTVGGNMHLSAPDSLVADTNGLGAGSFLPKTLGQST